MRVGHVTPAERRGFFHRFGWLIAFATVGATALGLPWLTALGAPVIVYPTTDFSRLPISATAANVPAAPESPQSCVSLQYVDGSPKLVDEACGSPASTFRVIGRVSDESQCVKDADLTYSSSSGAVCLDYDWAADQCLRITDDSVSKVDCADKGVVGPEMAIIGAVDVSYCRGGGIAHPVRHFTVCTLGGNEFCKERMRGI